MQSDLKVFCTGQFPLFSLFKKISNMLGELPWSLLSKHQYLRFPRMLASIGIRGRVERPFTFPEGHSFFFPLTDEEKENNRASKPHSTPATLQW